MLKELKEDSFGLYRYGYVKDFQLERLQKLLEGTNLSISNVANPIKEINTLLDEVNLKKFNEKGWDNYYGKELINESVTFLRIPLKAETVDKKQIFCWFWYDKEGNVSDFTWGTDSDWQKYLGDYKYLQSKFFIGGTFNDLKLRMYFDKKEKAEAFLDEIRNSAMEEAWSLDKSSIKYPVLNSYLGYTLYKIITEYLSCDDAVKSSRLGFSEDKKFVAFNSNLLSRTFQGIFIGGEYRQHFNSIYIHNPRRMRTEDFEKNGINDNQLKPAKFFSDIDDVVFHTEWRIEWDTDEAKIKHIITRLSERFKENTTLAHLKGVVEQSIELAKRNYKLVVPMYYPEKEVIQFLMPLYFIINDQTMPVCTCALVLSLNPNTGKSYIPETIFDLDIAYNDARLIAKPDNEWLRPKE